jgi:hypothetical protein
LDGLLLTGPTNDRVVQLLEEVKAQLDAFTKRQAQIARDLTRPGVA